jgi:hypothetical protein
LARGPCLRCVFSFVHSFVHSLSASHARALLPLPLFRLSLAVGSQLAVSCGLTACLCSAHSSLPSDAVSPLLRRRLLRCLRRRLRCGRTCRSTTSGWRGKPPRGTKPPWLPNAGAQVLAWATALPVSVPALSPTRLRILLCGCDFDYCSLRRVLLRRSGAWTCWLQT